MHDPSETDSQPASRTPLHPEQYRATTHFEAAAQFVEFGLREQLDGRRESASGPGSSLAATTEARDFLERIIDCHQVQSILDLGCGDWNWMRHVTLLTPQGGVVDYTGYESNADLVEQLNARHGSASCRFEHRDIVTAEYPEVDLIIVRDVLFHLPTDLAAEVVGKCRRHGRLLLTTTYPGETAHRELESYLPIEGWGFRRVNMALAPFHLAEFQLESVCESRCAHQGFERHLALYGFR